MPQAGGVHWWSGGLVWLAQRKRHQRTTGWQWQRGDQQWWKGGGEREKTRRMEEEWRITAVEGYVVKDEKVRRLKDETQVREA